MKIVNTSGLRTLVRSAAKRGYNRQIDLKKLNRIVDEDGVHVLIDWMLHEHKGGLRCEPHVRCQALIKVKGTMEPSVAWLDVEVGAFNLLIDAEAVSSAIADASSSAEEEPDPVIVGQV